MNCTNPDPLAKALAGSPAPKRARKPRARKALPAPNPSPLEAVLADFHDTWRNPLRLSRRPRAPRPTGALRRTAKAVRQVAADHAILVYDDRWAKGPMPLVNTPKDRGLGYLDRLLCLPPNWPPGFQAYQVAYHLSAEFCGPDSASRHTWAAAFSAAVYAAELARAPRPNRLRMQACTWGRPRRRTR